MSQENKAPEQNTLENIELNITTNRNNEEKELDSKWSFRIVLLLKRIGEKSMGYRWIHEQEHKYYLSIEYWLGVIQIVITTLFGVITSGTLVSLYSSTSLDTNTDALVAITLVELILSVFLGIIIGIREYSGFKERSDKHKEVSTKFARIYHSIQEQMALNIEQREHDKTFLRDKIRKFDGLLEDMLSIRKKTLEKYMETTKDKNMTSIGELENIEIAGSKEDAKNIAQVSSDKKKYEIERWISHF